MVTIKHKLFFVFCVLTVCFTASAQATPNAQETSAEMADLFFKEGKVYVVVVVASMVFIGMALYMFMIDRKLTRMEKKMENKD